MRMVLDGRSLSQHRILAAATQVGRTIRDQALKKGMKMILAAAGIGVAIAFAAPASAQVGGATGGGTVGAAGPAMGGQGTVGQGTMGQGAMNQGTMNEGANAKGGAMTPGFSRNQVMASGSAK